MLNFFVAFYPEAAPLIRAFSLKKVNMAAPFDEYLNEAEGIRLTLTGTGSVAAAAAVSSACTKHMPGRGDFLVNLGTCAGSSPGGLFLCNKIIEEATGRSFYPDMLYPSPWKENTVVTLAKPLEHGLPELHEPGACVKKPVRQETAGTDSAGRQPWLLYDMEAAGVYQSGSYYFGPHQMQFWKVVSDSGQGRQVTADQVAGQMENCLGQITEAIETLQRAAGEQQSPCRQTEAACRQTEADEQLCRDLHCSETMKNQVRQLFRYWRLAGVPYQGKLKELYRDRVLPCKDRREGKRCFEEIRESLL
ncbi:MAG: hypothetical protein LUH14_09195 [Clostridiaceae bacterium]|nr:hypothetical protein [Clostridiaceae bacterium]